MTHPAPITLFDYMSALTSPRDIHPSRGCDAPITGGCERCHAAITPHDAYFARFGTLRCRDCIGTDGFATVTDLELFRQTATLPCSGCGQPVQPAEISPDGTSCTYHCPTCGTTAHYTAPAVA
ncbi:MAG: hypothetical protein WBF34_19620 [Streptosporangiaceae bacterium]